MIWLTSCIMEIDYDNVAHSSIGYIASLVDILVGLCCTWRSLYEVKDREIQVKLS